MQRVTVPLDDERMDELDRIIAERVHQNRSEAIRGLAWAGLAQANREGHASRPCVAVIVCTYDHRTRGLSRRLTDSHHDLSVSSLHVHLESASKSWS